MSNEMDELGPSGRAFWDALTADLEFDAHETRYLLEACRTLDVIDGLAAAVEADGLMIAGSMGQRVIHPAVAEVRQQQASFVRLVGALHLPADVQAHEAWKHQRAVAGAAGRWQAPVRQLRVQ